MRTQPLAQAASLYSVTQPIRTPPLNRLLVCWPRYLQVRSHGANQKFTTTRLVRDLPQKKKAYSTNADFQIPLAGINDIYSTGDSDELVTATAQAHDDHTDHRYHDPKDYLEDYGVEIPEETIEKWQADLRAHPPAYAREEYKRWLEDVAMCQPVTRQHSVLLGDAQPVQKLHMGKRYQTTSKWKAAFLRLYAQFDPRLDAKLRKPVFLGDPRAPEWARPFLEAPDKDTMQTLFLNLDGSLASAIWPHIMLYVLYKHPERALEILDISMFAARQTSAVELVFSFAMEFAMRSGPEAGKSYLQDAWQFLRVSFRPDHIVDHATFEKNIRLLRTQHTTGSARALYRMLNERGFPLRSWSHLHFAYQLAKHDHILEAVEALKAAVNTAERTPSSIALSETGAFRSVCNVILRKLMAEKDGYQASLQVISSLSQLGFRMTTPLTNVLMLSAVEAGDTITCMGLYNTMPEQGIERDSWTYDFAMRALRKTDDGDQIQNVVNEAFQYQGDGRDYVQNAAMRCLGAFYAQESPRIAFERLLEIYQQHFDLQPLIKLGVLPARNDSTAPGLLQPDKATIHVMLHYFLTGVEDSTERIWYMWQTLRQLMRTERFWAECGTSPYFYTSFIHALGRSRQQLKYCPLILKDMLRINITEGADNVFNPELLHIRPAAPNTYVLNVLLQAFMRHGHHLAADKMRDFMKERNIPADLVTHNSIIEGYARQQDVERASSALKELRTAGLKADDFTRGALRFIEDRDALQTAMEQGREPTVEGQDKGWASTSVLHKVSDIWDPQPQHANWRAHSQDRNSDSTQRPTSFDQASQNDKNFETEPPQGHHSARRTYHTPSSLSSLNSLSTDNTGSTSTLLEDSDLSRLLRSSELESERTRKHPIAYAGISTDTWRDSDPFARRASPRSSSITTEKEEDAMTEKLLGSGDSTLGARTDSEDIVRHSAGLAQTSFQVLDGSSSLLGQRPKENGEAVRTAHNEEKEDKWTWYSPHSV